jgi:hypothetical protein
MSDDIDTIVAAREVARMLGITPVQVHHCAATDLLPVAYWTPKRYPRFYASEMEAIAARVGGRTPAGAA